ncbi:MAG: NERD domain-containing protein [Actinomycetia bacterium]|nr:NERD domain-containing protein [Actinomycetes bacterium]
MLQETRDRHQRALHTEGLAETGVRTARVELDAAGRRKSIWNRLFRVQTVPEYEAEVRLEDAVGNLNEATAHRQQLEQKVEQQSAGVEGEDALAEALAELSDDWVMLRGYRNRRGETDHILVGPLGLWAVEVKTYRVRLNVHGDQWWFERLDRWGNIVAKQAAVDRSGRTWARQVNEVANDLFRSLEQNRHPITVNRAVMLMHGRASLGRCRNPNVDLVGTDPRDLLRAIEERSSPLSPDTCRSVVTLIRDDHRRHNRRRGRTRRTR